MLNGIKSISSALLFAIVLVAGAASPAITKDASWRVSKSSGEVSIETQGAQPVALTNDATLRAGGTIRTGANGRVLLTRGAETILVSPNSVVELPAARASNSGLTKVLQRSGVLLFDVERKNVRHFEVMTPYLAAVVKGTQFRVGVDEAGSRVEVLRGQVQVTDYRSGQRALVNRNQSALVSLRGTPGLTLSGAGVLSPIEFGRPQVSPVSPVPTTRMRSASATAPETSQRPGIDARTAAPPMQRQSGNGSGSPQSPRTPQSTVVAASRWSVPDSGNDAAWGGDVIGWLRDTFGFKRHRKGSDDIPFLAVPIMIGLSVAAGSMIVRRRRAKPPKQPHDRE